MDDGAKGARMGRRSKRQDAGLWDDEAFRQRVAWIAGSQNRSISEVLRTAGLSPNFLDRVKSEGGRTITSLIRLARSLDVPVITLIEGESDSC
jgi:hypothetical protein